MRMPGTRCSNVRQRRRHVALCTTCAVMTTLHLTILSGLKSCIMSSNHCIALPIKLATAAPDVPFFGNPTVGRTRAVFVQNAFSGMRPLEKKIPSFVHESRNVVKSQNSHPTCHTATIEATMSPLSASVDAWPRQLQQSSFFHSTVMMT